MTEQFVKPHANTFSEMSNQRREGVCEIIRKISTVTPTGGSKESWVLVCQEAIYGIEQVTPIEVTGQNNGATIHHISFYDYHFPIRTDIWPGDRILNPGSIKQWVPEKTYSVGQKVIPTFPDKGNGHWYECVYPGTSSEDEPTWLTQRNVNIVDVNGVIFKEMGEYIYLEVVGDSRGTIPATELVVRCKEVRNAHPFQ